MSFGPRRIIDAAVLALGLEDTKIVRKREKF